MNRRNAALLLLAAPLIASTAIAANTKVVVMEVTGIT